jgi:protein-S-isoprenylcysteine O-methyltransferase Ste14
MSSAGIDARVLSRADKPVQKYFAFLENFMTAAIIAIIAAHMFFEGRFLLTTPIFIIDYNSIAGFITGIAGLAICRVAQKTIGLSWRVGIDEGASPGLITDGIYSYMRNPTYTGLYLLCAGVWIMSPTALYAFWILIFFIMMEFQVRLEERYLLEVYGDEYQVYYNSVKRYIPFII